MGRLVEFGRYFILLGVLAALLASVATFLVVAVRMGQAIYHLLEGAVGGEPALATAEIVSVLDALLLAVVLYIFAAGLYELFFAELRLPGWIVFHNLDELKTRLISVIILIMAVTFLEHVVEWKNPPGLLMFGAAIALVSLALALYLRFGHVRGQGE